MPGHGFDFCVEVAVSDRLVLIERHAEVGKRIFIQRGAVEISIPLVPVGILRGEDEGKGVRREDRIRLP